MSYPDNSDKFPSIGRGARMRKAEEVKAWKAEVEKERKEWEGGCRQPKTDGRWKAELPIYKGAPAKRCWNCGAANHNMAACAKPRQKMCFGCGYPQETLMTCPRCSSEYKAGKRPEMRK